MTTPPDDVDLSRRRFLTAATTVVGGIGAACATAPFIQSWFPSARAQAMGIPIEVDVSKLAVRAQLTVEWRGQPIWIIHRSPEELASLQALDPLLVDPNSNMPQQPPLAHNLYRSLKPEYLVLIGICTHLGCVPTYRPDIGSVEANWPGGFFCPCHGSKYDLAGRVYKNVPAPSNLVVPPYRYVSDTVILIGENAENV